MHFNPYTNLQMLKNIRSILFIRRDNIGDLVCTTPAIHAVRKKFPDARIGILVNTYNTDMVLNNPDIDEVYTYQKAKHALKKNKFSVWWSNYRVLRNIRKKRYDVAIGCGSYSPMLERYTFFSGAKLRIGYIKKGARSLFYNNPLVQPDKKKHEVVNTFNLVRPLGINDEPAYLRVVPGERELEMFAAYKMASADNGSKPLIALAISARILKNKWPVDNFIQLAERIILLARFNVLFLWAPGSKDNPTFPGDDDEADKIITKFDKKVLAYPTPTLNALTAALAASDMVVSLDTGNLHIAAALGKPTVALMTKSKSMCWYPWKTEHILITAEEEVKAISVDNVFEAVIALSEKLPPPFRPRSLPI